MDLIEQKKISQDKFSRHPWEIARLKIALHFIKSEAAPKCIIDFGSGDAYYSKNIAKRYPTATVFAVDINYTDSIVSEWETPPNLKFVRSIEEIGPQYKCDHLLMMDVLEHIADPNELLRQLLAHSSITPETNIFLTVPAYQLLFNKHDEVLGHFKRYTRKGLTSLLKETHFQIKSSGYFFASLLPIRVLEKLKFLNISPGNVSSWNKGKTLSAVMLNVFWLEFKIALFFSRLNIHLPGLTCYSLCRPLP